MNIHIWHIWEIGILSQLFIKGYYTEVIFLKKLVANRRSLL